jgi:hypothetical protein
LSDNLDPIDFVAASSWNVDCGTTIPSSGLCRYQPNV